MPESGEGVALACGADSVRAPLPAGLGWERLQAAIPRVADPWPLATQCLLDRALDGIPAGRLTAARAITVLVPDETRPAPLGAWVEAIAEALTARGVAASRVTFLTASGVHAGESPPPLRRAVEATGMHLRRHHGESPVRTVGRCPSGLEVELDRDYADADLRLSLGGVSFHYFAGFGGGPKMVFPGVAARRGVAENHRRALGPLPPGGLHAGCAPGRIEGNPVAEEIAAAARLLPPEVALHFVAAGTEWIPFAGDTGLAEARRTVLEAGARGAAESADCVVASAGGAPLDVNLVQAHKALRHASAYCREGGAIVFWAEVAGGPGSDAMRRWLALESLEELEEQARTDYDLNAQTAISLRRLTARHRVVWRGGACPEWIARTGAVVADGDDEAWRLAESACRATGGFEHGIVLPHPTTVVPRSPAQPGEA